MKVGEGQTCTTRFSTRTSLVRFPRLFSLVVDGPRLSLTSYGGAAQYGLQTDSSILPGVEMLVGELLWLPSASTPSLWLLSTGFIRLLLPAEAVLAAPVQEDSMRLGERSPPAATIENW